MSQLLKRVLSAAAIIILIGVVYFFYQARGMHVLSALLILIAINEYVRMTFPAEEVGLFLQRFFYIVMGLAFLTACFGGPYAIPYLSLYSTLALAFPLWALGQTKPVEVVHSKVLLAGSGFIYCVAFPTLALNLLIEPSTEPWFWLLLAIVITTDVAAYFSGIRWGNKKLMPNVSPKKTRAGSYGALLAAGLVSSIFCYFVMDFTSIQNIIGSLALGLLASAAAQTGDLFESMIKRVANVKDSGNIMPGHGGLLDRIDGILFAAPVIYCGHVILH